MHGSYEKFRREEFIEFWRRHETMQRSLWFLACYLGGMLLFAIPGFLIEKMPWLAVLWFPLFFGYLIFFPLWFMRVRGDKVDKRFLKCPACKSPLMGPGHLVVTTTGKCGTCGEMICE